MDLDTVTLSGLQGLVWMVFKGFLDGFQKDWLDGFLKRDTWTWMVFKVEIGYQRAFQDTKKNKKLTDTGF
jgi:hypothetical protein